MDKSEIRKDYFKNEYVIIAPRRAMRPDKSTKVVRGHIDQDCFFCPTNFPSDQVITYQDNNQNGSWEVVSFLNKYPAVTLDNLAAYGQAEVIIETRSHNLEIGSFSNGHIVRVINAYIDRYIALKKIDGIKHVIVFKNEGGKAGASIPHSHSQIIALPIVPPKIAAEIRDFINYKLDHSSCPYCDIIKKENSSKRAIWQDENVFVLSPYASEYPYGVWIIPKRHFKSIDELSPGEKISIAKSFKLALGKLDSIDLSYNYFFENSVGEEDYHMHIKIAPRPNIWAGLELGTGVIVNVVSPEAAAEFYRS